MSPGSFTQDDGGESNSKDKQQKNASCAVLHSLGVFVLRNLRADYINVIRQCHDPLENEIGPTLDLPRHFITQGVGGSEHDPRGLAGGPADTETGRRKNSGDRVGQAILAYGLPSGVAEGEAAFAQRV